MKSFKKFLTENIATQLAALGLAGAAMAAPPKPEATEYIVDYMKQKEGFRAVAEPDKDAKGKTKPVVVGYGTTHVYPDTKKPIKVGEKITPEKAEELIKSSIEKDITPQMEKIPNWDQMDAGKQAALLSFGYNLGHNFYGSKGFETISKNLKNKEWDQVPETLNMYNKAGGKVLGGLVKRRAEEGKLWSSGLPSQEKTTEKPKEEKKVTEKKPVEVKKTEEPSSDYEVKPNDNLSKIAKQQGKTLDEIIKLNPQIKDPNKIQPGQKIKVK